MSLPNVNFMDYFREVANSTKFQISAALTFGTSLYLIWCGDHETTKIIVTILFLFPASMLIISLLEKLCFGIISRIKRTKQWNGLTPEELNFISYYINNNTRTRYVRIFNGTYTDSGIINALIEREVLYMASPMSEFRGGIYDGEQHFPFNITDKAFSFFKKKLNVKSISKD